MLIDLPKDVQLARQDVPPDYDPPMNLPGYHPEALKHHPEQIRQVIAAVKRARRPILYIGGGVINAEASEELRKFARGRASRSRRP